MRAGIGLGIGALVAIEVVSAILEWSLPPSVGGRVHWRGRSIPAVALTFDDGPTPYTGAVLDILRREAAPATFFVLGRRVMRDPAMARWIVAEGHDAATVKRVEHLVAIAEYKRRQAAPGVKISSKNFGRDRRYPITNRFRG